ncbi:Arginyl-tRNA--protein transferase 1 [Haplosporangium sp. Z 11]|nr:Arginyl-tRNA--protein transferase 1 [Haplosporangium sp. Z 11]
MSDPYSIIKPVGFTIASCGYCGKENSAHVYGAFAYRLTCKDYQDLLDRGWRRFGLYLYRPNPRDSLNALEFTPSKGQRRTLTRLNRFIKNQYVPVKISRGSVTREDTSALEEHSPSPEPPHPHSTAHNGARRKSISPPLGRGESTHAGFIQNIHAADMDKMEPGSDWKDFKVVLEPATFSQEKYDLYCAYQTGIHRVAPSKLTRESFDNSTIRTPLITENTTTDQQCSGFVGHGTYHQCYYIDNKLIAVAVLDILPRCVSSDYFYYDPSLSSLSLGKYSTLREIALVQEIKAIPGFETMEYYTMGHYVPAASKTHYKATYQPSVLLDPETYDWVPFEKCKHLLQSKRYFPFRESEFFNPRVKGLLITMAVERRAREKARKLAISPISPAPAETSLMDVDSSDIEALGVQERNEDGSSDEEGHKRKRSQHEQLTPSESLRCRKRPSLTPPPPTSSLPPPGMMNPEDVTDQDLSQLVVFQDDKAMMFTDSDSFKHDKEVSKTMRDYFAAVGPTLASRMLVFAQ